jgi:hypothetical protein
VCKGDWGGGWVGWLSKWMKGVKARQLIGPAAFSQLA